MTGHEKIREQLSAYLDGELSAAEMGRVEKAVAGDAELAAELDQLRAVRKLIRKLPRRQAPPELVSRVLGQAERMHLVGPAGAHARPPRLRWVRWAASAAIVLIALGTGVVITQTLMTPGFDEMNAVKSGDERAAAPLVLARDLKKEDGELRDSEGIT
ncbi:MAG: zf-HC2 domain-containing protein, partial [Phycisphaerae bacterium]|nr:zf-HC2 domain-containing protein [Phycisphaerae bacterium]